MITNEAQLAAAVVELHAHRPRDLRAIIAEQCVLEEKERRPSSCILCEHDEPTGHYRGRNWCRACGRIW